ncbi:hypothetical protein [Xanthobacter flavus]|uniref:hypothetical protein n=1 Tax=Xanthobacter flavus TaxID=281 RepID=UPI003729730F
MAQKRVIRQPRTGIHPDVAPEAAVQVAPAQEVAERIRHLGLSASLSQISNQARRDHAFHGIEPRKYHPRLNAAEPAHGLPRPSSATPSPFSATKITPAASRAARITVRVAFLGADAPPSNCLIVATPTFAWAGD